MAVDNDGYNSKFHEAIYKTMELLKEQGIHAKVLVPGKSKIDWNDVFEAR